MKTLFNQAEKYYLWKIKCSLKYFTMQCIWALDGGFSRHFSIFDLVTRLLGLDKSLKFKAMKKVLMNVKEESLWS